MKLSTSNFNLDFQGKVYSGPSKTWKFKDVIFGTIDDLSFRFNESTKACCLITNSGKLNERNFNGIAECSVEQIDDSETIIMTVQGNGVIQEINGTAECFFENGLAVNEARTYKANGSFNGHEQYTTGIVAFKRCETKSFKTLKDAQKYLDTLYGSTKFVNEIDVNCGNSVQCYLEFIGDEVCQFAVLYCGSREYILLHNGNSFLSVTVNNIYFASDNSETIDTAVENIYYFVKNYRDKVLTINDVKKFYNDNINYISTNCQQVYTVVDGQIRKYKYYESGTFIVYNSNEVRFTRNNITYTYHNYGKEMKKKSSDPFKNMGYADDFTFRSATIKSDVDGQEYNVTERDDGYRIEKSNEILEFSKAGYHISSMTKVGKGSRETMGKQFYDSESYRYSLGVPLSFELIIGNTIIQQLNDVFNSVVPGSICSNEMMENFFLLLTREDDKKFVGTFKNGKCSGKNCEFYMEQNNLVYRGSMKESQMVDSDDES